MKWGSQLPSSLLSAHKPPAMRQSSARLLQGMGAPRKAEQPPKQLYCSDISTQTFPFGFSSTSRQEGALEPAHTDSLWLPHWEHVSVRDPLKVVGPKTKQPRSVVRDFPSKPGQWLCPSARACVGNRAQIQPCDPWPWALWLMGISLCASHTPFLPPENHSWHCCWPFLRSWKIPCSVVFHFPVWDIMGIMLSSTLKCCKGWRWKMTFD